MPRPPDDPVRPREQPPSSRTSPSSAPTSPTRSASSPTSRPSSSTPRPPATPSRTPASPNRDVDGIFTAGAAGWSPTLQLAEYLGIQPTYTDSTSVGGSSFVIHVEHAAAAIATGLIDVALITHGESGASGGRRGGSAPPGRSIPWHPAAQFEMPYHVGGAAHALRDGLHAPHAPVRHDPRAARRDRRRHAQVGHAQPQGDDARPASRSTTCSPRAGSPTRSTCSTAASSPTPAARS